jgi:hypothetical protein
MRTAGKMLGLAAALAGAATWLLGAGVAEATMAHQKQAKALGFPAANCQYCHEDKLPKKAAHKVNERGQYLVDQKEKHKAKEIDLAWLKEYVEKKK